MDTKSFIELFLLVIVAVALYTPLQSFVTAANATGAAGSLLSLIPLLFVVVIVAAFVYVIARAAK